MTDPRDFLIFRNASKAFPGVRALDDVSFGVAAGSVHGLVGENGAGKSTLLKALSGAHALTDGSIAIDGVARSFDSTSEALTAGVAVIYQELHLAPEMTVAENLFLGHMPSRLGLVSKRRMNTEATRHLRSLGESIDPRTKVGRLPIAQRQMVEIAKALTRDAKIIAFDEPTSSLSERETRRLFEVIGELRDQGRVILYVSHRLDEIFELCDAVTVLRDGRHVETFRDMTTVDHDTLVNRMVGRDIENVYDYRTREHGDVALEVDGLMGPGLTAPVSFSVNAGEVLGVFGLVGAGRTELTRLIYGAVQAHAGSVRVEGKVTRLAGPRESISQGVMVCPEDRKSEGIIPVLSVLDNLNISARRRNGFFIRPRWERTNADEQVARLDIRTPSLRQSIANLSGGNQQKVILARWLSERVRVLLLDEPTRGIDVGAKSEIYNIIYDLAKSGVAVVMVSSDLPEVMGVADRLMIMREGAVSGFLSREEANEERVLNLALPTSDAELTNRGAA